MIYLQMIAIALAQKDIIPIRASELNLQSHMVLLNVNSAINSRQKYAFLAGSSYFSIFNKKLGSENLLHF
jgi:hypothetical protein